MNLSFSTSSTGNSVPLSRSLPPKPKPFDMTEPFYENGIWCFWLTADMPVLQFVSHLNCVLNVSFLPPPFALRAHARILIRINPRYDHQEAWLWIYDQLELESGEVELNVAWERALVEACVCDDSADNAAPTWLDD